MKARNWCFTLNNWTENEYTALKHWCQQSQQVSYAVLGKETGEESHVEHIQGYLELNGARTLQWVKRQPGLRRAHAEPRRGSGLDAAAYCQKDGDFWQTGQLKEPRKRSDLIEIQSHLDDGRSLKWIARNYFSKWCQYGRRFEAYVALQRSIPRQWKSWVNVIYGRSGVGKTRFVYQQHADDDVWVYPGQSWFDGYKGQPVALFDDYRGDMDISLLLRVLDRYPMVVPVKGSHQNWCPRRIYITSNLMPEMWYPDLDSETQIAFRRRLNRVDVVNESLFD